MKKVSSLPTGSWNCNDVSGDSNATSDAFDTAVETMLGGSQSAYLFKRDKYDVPLITAPIEMEMLTRNKSGDVVVGTWNPKDRFKQNPNYKKKEIRRFFRVGKQIIGEKYWFCYTIILRCCSGKALGVD